MAQPPLIHFRPCHYDDVPLFVHWINAPHVKKFWTLESHHDDPAAYITDKIKGNGYDYPYIIELDATPIGYIQYWDCATYPKPCPVFPDEPLGTVGIDIFIGDKNYLGQGYGTQALQYFVNFLFKNPAIKKLVIDPDIKNKPAIQCYKKTGFTFVRNVYDSGATFHIMEMCR